MLHVFEQFLIDRDGISAEEFAALSSLLSVRNVEKGTVLLEQGGICRHTFFVAKGLLRSFTVDENGREHIIQFAPENWLVADRSSLFLGSGSEFAIDAVEGSTVIALDSRFTEKAAEISPQFRKFNVAALHKHIRTLQHRIAMLLGADAETRYLEFIDTYPEIPLRVPQWMIASYLGITPESLSRVRKELARRNFRPMSAS